MNKRELIGIVEFAVFNYKTVEKKKNSLYNNQARRWV